MGEYIKLNGSDASRVKIGSCENLGYITYDELKYAVEHGAQQAACNAEPKDYIDPAAGWFYRWPFTSELTGGRRNPLTAEAINRRDYERALVVDVTGLPIVIAHRDTVVFERKCSDGTSMKVEVPCPYDAERFAASGAKRIMYGVQGDRLEIVGEKLMPDGSLQTLIRCPVCGALCRIDEDEAALLRNQCKLLAAKMKRCLDELSVSDVTYMNDLLVAGERVRGAAAG